MLACTIHGAKDLRLEQQALPALAEKQVLVKLAAGGICGSDIHYYSHGRVGNFVIREPLTPGHEASGTVADVGPGVTRVKPGDKIAINPGQPCGHCEYCREGRENLCVNMRFSGSASLFPHVQGMFRENFIVRESQCHVVTEDIPMTEIACAEPFSCGLHAVTRAGDLVGKDVLVTGAGTIGSMCILAAKLAGANRIVAIDLSELRLAAAAKMGADLCIKPDRDVDALEQLKSPAGQVHVAIEATGNPLALANCFAAVRRGGRVVQVGTLPGEGFHFAGNVIMQRELDYVGCFRFGTEFDRAVRLLRERRADVRPLLSGSFPLEQAREAFELATDPARSTKVHITFE